MTHDQFRGIALKLDGAIEDSHMGQPDFRANGKIFATIYPDGERGMVKLTPAQQGDLIAADSEAFEPASGAWGRQGCTTVHIAVVDADNLGAAMTLAWQNTLKTAATSKTKRKTSAKKQTRKR